MRSRLGDHPIFVKIDLFVLDRTPETLDKDVVVDLSRSSVYSGLVNCAPAGIDLWKTSN
jgi:hypothetical protein